VSQADLYMSPDPQHGGHLVARQLDHLGVRTVFTIPGETFLSALDGLFDQPAVSTIVCRQEGGATMMAEAWAKMTGMPGVAFVTRAPGLSNAMSGLVVARQDQTPLLLLVGLPRTTLDNRGDLQVAEFEAMMGAVAKWSTIVRDPERIGEVIARGYALAQTGRPGPVVIGFPENTLNAAVTADVVDPIANPNVTPDQGDIKTISTLLGSSQSPLIIVGGPGWSRDVENRVALFAQRTNIPVVASFRCQDYLDNRHPCYAGHAGIAIDPQVSAAIRGADTLLVLGANLGDITTGQYELIRAPRPEQTLIHVQSSEQQLSQSCSADVAIAVPMETFSECLAEIELPRKPSWSAWRRDLRSAYERSLQPQRTPGAVQLPDVIALLSDMLPDDAIVTNGAGNYTQFLHRYFQYKGYRTCLAPASGSMGYGLPAGIAAQLAAPDKRVVAVAGDGCLMMTVQELATAVQYGLPIITVVVNNGMYGTIRMHQERRFPARVIGTTLVNPDFCDLARSFGIEAEAVTQTDQFEGALGRAMERNHASLIEVVIDAEAVAPELTLSGLRHR
jgi:acetolactate synthase I/II/III large subunit